MTVCSVQDCGGPVAARGWCDMHYHRWRSHGDPLTVRFLRGVDPPLRFWPYVDAGGDCWQWTGTHDSHGYAVFRLGRGQVKAYRYCWELLVGPIPNGLTIDHLCKNPMCVYPDHLEVVDLATNVSRGWNPAARNAIKTSCQWGHEFTSENTYVYPDGRRSCRNCQRDYQRRWRIQQKEQSA